MGRALIAISIGMLATACAAAQAPATSDANARGPAEQGCGDVAPETGHALQVTLSVERNGKQRPLCAGQALTANDALWIKVDLQAEAHVRMVFIAPDGQAGELMPQSEDELTRAAMFRAPKGLLSHAAGEAQLFLVAATRPLAESDATMQLMLDLIRDTGTLVDREGALHPPARSTTPPPDMMQLDTSENLFADFDDKGMAMLAISLRAAL